MGNCLRNELLRDISAILSYEDHAKHGVSEETDTFQANRAFLEKALDRAREDEDFLRMMVYLFLNERSLR